MRITEYFENNYSSLCAYLAAVVTHGIYYVFFGFPCFEEYNDDMKPSKNILDGAKQVFSGHICNSRLCFLVEIFFF